MATRNAAGYISRSGKVLSEEEKSAENVYIKVFIDLISVDAYSFK